MKYALIINSTVTQTQPNAENGFIEVPSNVVCGMIDNGDGSFSNPQKSQEDIFLEKSLGLRDLAQKLLDDTAISIEFDDMKSARASAGVPLEGTETAEEMRQYNNAVALGQWHRKVWAYMAILKNNVLTTPTPIKTEAEWVDAMPTAEELLASLPAYIPPA